MNSGNAIELKNAGVCYRVHKSRRRTLREAVFRSLFRKDELIEIWALREVCLELEKGGALGVIGDNGAGKSTLCLLLSQIMTPTIGSVEVSGRVSALLTLGAGFQPDLTGRDNIFLNGIYLGYSRSEVQEKYEEIVDFSELGNFIDLPVRTYSSGMRARLAFSIAASIRPEILIIDELMGVGDRKFQQKSTNRMREMIDQSQALVVVSHNMATIRDLCSKVVWLEKGRLLGQGPVDEMIARYEAR